MCFCTDRCMYNVLFGYVIYILKNMFIGFIPCEITGSAKDSAGMIGQSDSKHVV